MSFPNRGEGGGAPHLGKISTFSLFFLATSLSILGARFGPSVPTELPGPANRVTETTLRAALHHQGRGLVVGVFLQHVTIQGGGGGEGGFLLADIAFQSRLLLKEKRQV